MVSDLRKKFVMVTTALMLVTFGAILLVYYIYNSYWNKVDTADMLDLIADSGYFLNYSDRGVRETIINITEGVSPIGGIVVNGSGEVISSEVIGHGNKLEVSDVVIKKILEADDNTFQIDRYLYSRRDIEDSKVLIVIMDTSIDDNIIQKVIGTIMIMISGILIIIVITFYLSKFVTEPASQAILREKRFISDASHELKTPLSAININAQALHQSNPDNIYTQNIVNESERMGRLIERLLTLSKLDEGGEASKSKVSLSDIVTEMALTYESIAFEKNIAYEYSVADDIFINGNDDELRQVLAILIDNAVKNAGDNGAVAIDCCSNRGEATIEVRNSGQGISPEDLPHVFERFYTSDTSRSNKSFGLGLAIAKAIVQGHDGEIKVSSTPGEITKFSLKFKIV